MQNFFKKSTTNNVDFETTNPFAKPVNNNTSTDIPTKSGRRLNIIDMEVLNSSETNAEIDFMEIRMNNLYNIIHKNPQNLDPISLEKMKIEWETLRDKVYTERKKLKQQNTAKTKPANNFKSLLKGVSKLVTLFKFNSPKIKAIMETFNEINKEVEELVRRSTPVGEEEIKYGMLVNKIYQATKLNDTLANEIK